MVTLYSSTVIFYPKQCNNYYSFMVNKNFLVLLLGSIFSTSVILVSEIILVIVTVSFRVIISVII